MVPKDVLVLISKTWKYVPLYGNRDIANVMKLRIRRWGDYSRLSWWPNIITKVLMREAGMSELEREDVRVEAGVKGTSCVAGFGGGGRSHEPRSTASRS